jgi:hypothetical protein
MALDIYKLALSHDRIKIASMSISILLIVIEILIIIKNFC